MNSLRKGYSWIFTILKICQFHEIFKISTKRCWATLILCTLNCKHSLNRRIQKSLFQSFIFKMLHNWCGSKIFYYIFLNIFKYFPLPKFSESKKNGIHFYFRHRLRNFWKTVTLLITLFIVFSDEGCVYSWKYWDIK